MVLDATHLQCQAHSHVQEQVLTLAATRMRVRSRSDANTALPAGGSATQLGSRPPRRICSLLFPLVREPWSPGLSARWLWRFVLRWEAHPHCVVGVAQPTQAGGR
jgi:hypothetical protein